MFIFRGGDTHNNDAESAANMKKWMGWMQQLGQSGTLVEGEALHKAGKVVSGADKVVSDGPFAEAKELVGGYLIINAESIDQATEISKDCPVFDLGGSVEVRPVQKMDV